MPWLATLKQNEEGQDLIEYALVLALIAFAAIVGMNTVATGINNAFKQYCGYTQREHQITAELN